MHRITKNNHDHYIRYQHTNTSLQTTFYLLDTVQPDDTRSTHARKQKKRGNNNNTLNNYNSYIQHQHTIRSFQYKIPYLQYTSNIQIHSLQPTFMCPMSIAGVPFDSVRRFRATLLLRTTCMRP